MSDHQERSRRGLSIRKPIGIRELKANATRLFRNVRDSGASYLVTNRGRAVAVILPVEPASHPPDAAAEAAAWDAFMRAGRELERRFRAGKSGVRLLSASRR